MNKEVVIRLNERKRRLEARVTIERIKRGDHLTPEQRRALFTLIKGGK